MVQLLATPGNRSASSISAMSLSIVIPGRQCSSGLRLTTVSNISIGAGSVAVAARPALPNTEATSGKLLMIRSCACMSSAALVMDMPGSEAGMYSSVPSLRRGMNSLPSWRAGRMLTPKTTSATTMVVTFHRSTIWMIGR